MWRRTHSYFNIIIVNSAHTRLGCSSWDSPYRKYISTFHCVYWSDISDDTVEALGGLIVAHLNSDAIGYDTSSKEFVRIHEFSTESHIMTIKTLLSPINSTKTSKLINWFRNLFN